MQNPMWAAGCGVFLTLLGLSLAFAADNMTAFPAAEAGMTRYVIALPKQDDEAALRVELIVGKNVKTDAVNRYFFGGTLEVESIPGWGFDRYVLRKLGPMAGTLMAVAPDAPQVERFVALGGEPLGAALAVLGRAAERLAGDGGDGAALEWQDALRLTARRLEAAWLALEATVAAERERWAPEWDDIAAWRPALWPVVLLWAPVAAALVWLGLLLGGYLPAPSWLAARLGF